MTKTINTRKRPPAVTTVNSILRSSFMLVVFMLGISLLMLNTVVYSGFPGSIELLVHSGNGFQLKIDGSQTVPGNSVHEVRDF